MCPNLVKMAPMGMALMGSFSQSIKRVPNQDCSSNHRSSILRRSNQQQSTMQFLKSSIMVLAAIIFQCTTAMDASACHVMIKKIRGRTLYYNPCFTVGEYEYKVIQRALNNPCSDEASYWRRFYKHNGMAVPEHQKCLPMVRTHRARSLADCITAGQMKTMEPMARCLVINHNALCDNAIDFMTNHEINQYSRDAELGCMDR